MASIGKIALQMDANTSKFSQKVTTATEKVKKMSSSVAKSGFRLSAYERNLMKASTRTRTFSTTTSLASKSLSSLIGIGAGFVGFAALIGRATAAMQALGDSVERIDKLAKTGTKLGIATDRLAGLQLAAELTGIEVRQLDTGLQRMVRRIAEAGVGTGEAKSAIKELGLDAKRLAALSPDKQFIAIAGAMEKVATQADKVRLGFKLFDAEGVGLINTLALGEKKLEEIMKEAKDFGIAVGDKAAKKLADLAEAQTRSRKAGEGLGNAFSVTLAPAFEETAKKTTGAKIAFANFVRDVGVGVPRMLDLARPMTMPFRTLFNVLRDPTGMTFFEDLNRDTLKQIAATQKANAAAAEYKKTLEGLGNGAETTAKSVAKISEGFTGPKVSAGLAHFAQQLGLSVEDFLMQSEAIKNRFKEIFRVAEAARQSAADKIGDPQRGEGGSGTRQQFMNQLVQARTSKVNYAQQQLRTQIDIFKELQVIRFNTGSPQGAFAQQG